MHSNPSLFKIFIYVAEYNRLTAHIFISKYSINLSNWCIIKYIFLYELFTLFSKFNCIEYPLSILKSNYVTNVFDSY